MPWIDGERCTGCGICVKKCPADAIAIKDKHAKIDQESCVRCGVCHDICPQEAIRHDSEKIPLDVKANVDKTRRFMDLCAELLGSENEKSRCLQRMKKYFNKEKIIAEKTLSELDKFE
jgi:Fe-S-cluster-containing hydrogenase component 2